MTAALDLADPHTALRHWREHTPVRRHPSSGPGVWYLTRYADVRRALHDPGLARELDRLPAELAAPYRRWGGDPFAALRRNVFHLDPPDHTRLRRLIAPAFGARRITAVRRRVEQLAGDLLDAAAAAGGPVDVVEQIALPLPVLVTTELVGLPRDDHRLLRRLSDEMLRSGDFTRSRRAGMDFTTYLQDRLVAPGGLLGELAAAEHRGELTRPELLSTVFQLLMAGDETTVGLITNAVLELLRHPAQLDRLRADPALIGTAIEEVLRFNGPVGHAKPLYALTDLRYGGTTIPRGDSVLPVLLAANRDPEAFADPDVFDIGRAPNRHLGFGHGIHFCLGAELGRIQARAVVGALVRRFPALALAVEPHELPPQPDLFLQGVRRLPVWLAGPP
ncbi:cytochrome P450 [Actinoplanes sp. NPDC020271]|uniref:cytochrome P450 n=1 Tax=Actinoplanes sp. NPDC020271 TaxID=3363896 RepID=UPI003798B2C7